MIDRQAQSWTTPTFVEIRMDAEIGSYQDELEERNPPPRPQGLQPAATES